MISETANMTATARDLVDAEPVSDALHVDAKAQTVALGRPEKLIGAILVESGRLRQTDVELVLREAEEAGTRFGEAAMRLRLIRPKDLKHALALQYAFPYFDVSDAALSRKLPVASRPDAPFAEAMRGIRSRILDDWPALPGRARTVAVVSLDEGDGRSFIAANLAVSFAQAGERTLLIDADLRNPRQQDTFDVRSGTGLAGVLSGRGGFEQVMHFVGMDCLSLLQAGPPVPNPQELLARPAFRKLLDDLEPTFDTIVIDTPAARHASDAQLVARRAGAALLVARADVTRQDQLGQLARYLHQGGVRVASIINRR